MKVVAWNNGRHHVSGAGYGLKVARADRDQFFDTSWESVIVTLPNGIEIDVNTAKDSFWNDSCRELISKGIGQWLIESAHAPWPKGVPPEFELSPTNENRFSLGGPMR